MATRHPVKPLVRTGSPAFSVSRWLQGGDRIPRPLVWALFAIGLATPVRAALRHAPLTSGGILAFLAAMFAARLLLVDFVLAIAAKRR